ncbi:MAG: undecaprenyl-diphosphate phosphatase [bacterium]|nr:undecaprenyl-diphosphate phosphatase [bacterium]
MDLFQAIFMGIVQGLSEFLPISSSGHLVFSSNIYKFINGIELTVESNQEIFLDIMLHLGTLIAVFIFFRKEIWQILKALYLACAKKEYNKEDFNLGLYIILGTIITVLIAFPLKDLASAIVFKPIVVSILLIFTGVLLLFSENFSKKFVEKKDLDLKTSILMAVAQGLAALPGFSRSGLTIATGLLAGAERNKVARYSFLLSIPIILGASMFYPILTFDFKEIAGFNWFVIIIGTVVSGIVGYFCIKYFLKFVSKFSLAVFGWYCIILGLIMTTIFYYIRGVAYYGA